MGCKVTLGAIFGVHRRRIGYLRFKLEPQIFLAVDADAASERGERSDSGGECEKTNLHDAFRSVFGAGVGTCWSD